MIKNPTVQMNQEIQMLTFIGGSRISPSGVQAAPPDPPMTLL